MSILDIKGEDEKGHWYNIEMQIGEDLNFDKRSIYYWSKMVTEQLSEGMMFRGGLILSNKVAGPLYRLCKHFAELKDYNQIADIKFRKGDFFPELEHTINDHFKRVREISLK